MAFYRVDASWPLVVYQESSRHDLHYHLHHHSTTNSFQETSPLELAHRPLHTSGNYPGFLEASRGTVGLRGPPTEAQAQQTKSRTFFLERSVFDLVESHPNLALTDPELLGWYLSLTVQDRNLILGEGGFHRFLQRHPALELINHHVYVKYPDGTSSLVSPSKALKANRGRSDAPRPCLGVIQDIQQQMNEVICQRKHLVPVRDVLDTTSGSSSSEKPIIKLEQQVEGFKVPEGLGNCSLDMELDQCFQKKNLEENLVMCPNIAANSAQANPSKSVQSFDNECISEYCSCDSVQSDDHDGRDENPIPVQNKVGGDPNDNNQSISVCLDSKGAEVGHQKDSHAALAKTCKETAADAGEVIKRGGTRCSPENCSVPMSCVSSCNATIGPDLVQRSEASNQTEPPETADKNTITELHMSDLDSLVETFTKMKTAHSSRNACDSARRAQRSELHLLALQYIVCREHCWRLNYTCGEGLVSTPGDATEHCSASPPTSMSRVLEKLEADYHEMKHQIMQGIPLDQLKPLSVNTEKITAGATCTPARMTANVLRNCTSLDPYKSDVPDKENRCRSDQRVFRSQESQTQRNEAKEGKNKTKSAVTVILKDEVSDNDSHQQLDIKTELVKSEAWFDAKEDLNEPEPEPAEEKPHSTNHDNDGKGETEESSTEETQCSVLRVTNLPGDVTEREVMLWFRKYGASEVKITLLENDSRVAVVFIPNIQNAEAALRELNGFNAKGHTLNVEKGSLSDDGDHQQNRQKPKSTKPRSTETEPGTTGEESAPALSANASDIPGMVVSHSPCAKATFVPQHYGTMGSFDTLMSELRMLHPSVQRGKIVEALIELRAQHRGRLIGLPLREIREMASELLTRAEADAKA